MYACINQMVLKAKEGSQYLAKLHHSPALSILNIHLEETDLLGWINVARVLGKLCIGK